MISTGELRKGVVIELDGDLWQILDYHHIKMGRGSAQVRIKLRNVKKGSTVEKSFQAGERWPRAQIDRRPVQFLYRDGDDLHFMETESYEQFSLRAETLDDAIGFLKEGMTVDRTSYQGDTLGIELPDLPPTPGLPQVPVLPSGANSAPAANQLLDFLLAP